MQSIASFTELWNSMAPSCERQISAGGFVFQQGDPASHLYLVRSGRIRLVRYTWEGQRCTLFCAETGQTFAEAALFRRAVSLFRPGRHGQPRRRFRQAIAPRPSQGTS
jgi:CRP-like cAMP-binding protein